MLCVHGNPTWSYLWRLRSPRRRRGLAGGRRRPARHGLLRARPRARSARHRVDDLGAVLDALDVTGPVVTVAHDWGGPISLGWALAPPRPARARGPRQHRRAPARRCARAGADPAGPDARRCGTRCAWRRPRSSASRGASRPGAARRRARRLAAPYGTAARRHAIGAFVADIPLEPSTSARRRWTAIAAGRPALADVPALMLWGPRDPVFSDRYLRDLRARLPHARRPPLRAGLAPRHRRRSRHRHRRLGAGWSTPDEGRRRRRAGGLPTAPAGPAALGRVRRARRRPGRRRGRAAARAAPSRSTCWSGGCASSPPGLAATGVRAGDRVALLVPPGADLTAAAYACWRAGAVVVLADAGLGAARPGPRPARRGPRPRHRGPARARAGPAAGHPGPPDPRRAGEPGAAPPARLPTRPGRHRPHRPRGRRPPPPGPDAEAAVLFTSGATGPAKGVVYRHRQLQAQLDTLRTRLRDHPRRPARGGVPAVRALRARRSGIASAVPDCDVTAAHLTAAALADAPPRPSPPPSSSPRPPHCATSWRPSTGSTPTQRAALAGVRLVVSAGAPVPAALLHDAGRRAPRRRGCTPRTG